MSNRFDDMMVQGINTSDATAVATDILQGKTAYAGGQKITGTLVPSGGSGELNVFVQSAEPTKKDGIWIKDSGNYDTVKCLYYNAPVGDLIDPSQVTFLDRTTGDVKTAAQIIVNGYLYTFSAATTPKSYKYNLKEKTRFDLNIAALTFNTTAGCCYYNGLIYIFGYINGGNIGYYTFNPKTDILSSLMQTGVSASVGSNLAIISNVYVYQDVAYIYLTGTNLNPSITQISFNLSTKVGSKTSGISLSGYICTRIAGIGRYVYIASSDNKKLTRIDVIEGTSSVIATFTDVPNYPSFNSRNKLELFGFGNNIYIFIADGTNKDYYFVYDITNGNIKKVLCNYDYTLLGIDTYANETSNRLGSNDFLLLDEAQGLLYFVENCIDYTGTGSSAHYEESYQKRTSCMQLTDVGSDLSFTDGTAVLYLGTSNRFVKMLDDSSLYTGVQDTYLVHDGEMDSDHVAFYGDGEKWNVFKNPTSETCTITFDTDGGSGNIPSQTIIRGATVTDPQVIPVKSGNYVFDCWYMNNAPFDFNATISTDTTLVAHYIEYEETSYIQSTGTQYIDTGVVPKNSTRMVLELAITDTESNARNGWGSTGGKEAFLCGTVPSNNYFFGTVSNNWTATNTTINTDNLKHTFDISNSSIKLDNISYGTGNIGNTATDGQTLYLFALHTEYSNNGVYYQPAKERIYSCQIYDSNTLIRDFQPVKILSTGKYCLWDKVTKQFYYNDGTGNFIAGEVVSNG